MGSVSLTTLIALLLLPKFGGTTTLVRYDLEALTNQADQIVVATCKNSASHLKEGQIYTRTQLQVLQTLKGQIQQEITISLPGGVHNNRQIHWAGMPQFSPEEEVVLFLTGTDANGTPWPVGLVQGKFRIERQQAQKPVVVQKLEGVRFLPAGSAGKEVVAPSLEKIPLDDFLNQVRSYLAPAGRKVDENR